MAMPLAFTYFHPQNLDIQIYSRLTNHKAIYMVKITFDLDENLNEKFRKTIASTKGLYRGAIQEALIESIHLWISSTKKRKGKSNKKTISKNENKDNDEIINNV
jgi:phosphorylcholine metabolism protein LicD